MPTRILLHVQYYSTGGRSVYIYPSTSCSSRCRNIVETKQSHKSGHTFIKSQLTIPLTPEIRYTTK